MRRQSIFIHHGRCAIVAATYLLLGAGFVQGQVNSLGRPSDYYAGWIVKVIGTVELKIKQDGTTELLTPTNSRGTLLFVTSQLRCQSCSTAVVQFPWGVGLTNITSTNWTFMKPTRSLGASKAVEQFSPAGRFSSIDLEEGCPSWRGPRLERTQLQQGGIVHGMFSSYLVKSLDTVGQRPNLGPRLAGVDLRQHEERPKEILRSLDQAVPDYETAAKLLKELENDLSREPGLLHDRQIKSLLQESRGKCETCCRQSAIDLLLFADGVFNARYARYPTEYPSGGNK